MDYGELIKELSSIIQELEDAKTELTEQQEKLREDICMLKMLKEVQEDG